MRYGAELGATDDCDDTDFFATFFRRCGNTGGREALPKSASPSDVTEDDDLRAVAELVDVLGPK